MSGIFFIIDNPQNINNHQYTAIEMFINNVNVLFLSNSQRLFHHFKHSV